MSPGVSQDHIGDLRGNSKIRHSRESGSPVPLGAGLKILESGFVRKKL